MRIGHQNLTATNLTGVIRSPDRTVEYLVIYNNNPVNVYIRLGSPEIPTQRNFDITIPPLYIMAISVNSNQFGIRLGEDNVSLSLLTGTTVIEGMIDEAPPALGGVPIQAASFATSDLNSGITSFLGTTTLGPFNLTLWGGALIYVLLGASSGQAVVAVNGSASPAGPWKPLGTYAVWPNVPSMINVPRAVPFLQVIINSTAIAGESIISGDVALRAILSEVQNLAYNPGTQAITKTFNLAGVSSQQFTFVTVGLPAVSIAAIATAGTSAGAAITFLVEASSDLVNWRQVTARDQLMSQGVTLYRALGNLDLFIRVTIFQIVGGQNEVGSLYLSIPQQADLGYILNTIQQSLGDNKAPSNTNQDIYHELDNIRVNGQNNHSDLTLINASIGTTNTSVAAINTVLGTNQPYLAYLPSIYALENTNLPSLSNLATMVTSLTAINNNLSNIFAKLGGTGSYFASAFNCNPSTWTFTGSVMPTNGRIVYARLSAMATGIVTPPFMGFIGFGASGGGGVTGSCYQCQLEPIGGVGGGTQNTGPYQGMASNYGSIRDAGLSYGTNAGIYVNQVGSAGFATMEYEVLAVG